ncbi:G/U mismatch-specific DNA glycosylase [Planococcus salinus]|uniref:G/U mismatch-specific DNA glycosylase n=1 Tax=Planococcus salinus TaxID=1848460 RepID=UPI001864C0A0|nr:G/U mismatch-specific DNA glycosylase [Planococcus salinus]
MQPIPDHLRKGLKILFVGFNPSIRSAETGHHFANPTNRFWKLLFQAGLTPKQYVPEEDGQLLNLGYGLTNIVARPTKEAAEISKAEYLEGAALLQQKIKNYQPKAVCFVGKGVYQQFSSRRAVDWGEQPESVMPGTVEYVAPSSSGLVRMKLGDMIEIYKGLKKFT